MKNSNSELGLRLRNLRTQKKLTLHQVSKEVDIDSPMLSKIERGERLPTIEQLQRLCKFFKVAEADLKVMHTAEKIIKEYGVNDTTYDAVRLVEEQITPYITKRKAK
ncbi:MAG: helix-turn-helix transcriptional regulator [Sediminibacterium sp.]|nr:helix-turn-helix transcriptional regulator [Sediminibacterium sp.]